MYYWPPNLIAIVSYFIKKNPILFQFFDQYLSPINGVFLYIFCITEPNINFVTSILLCAMGLKSL